MTGSKRDLKEVRKVNKRAKNKAEKKRRQQICKLLDLCLQINGLQESERSLTGDHPTAFLRFSGHIAKIDVQLFPEGWDFGLEYSESDELRVDITKPDKLTRMIQWLEKFKMDQHRGNCGGPDNK